MKIIIPCYIMLFLVSSSLICGKTLGNDIKQINGTDHTAPVKNEVKITETKKDEIKNVNVNVSEKNKIKKTEKEVVNLDKKILEKTEEKIEKIENKENKQESHTKKNFFEEFILSFSLNFFSEIGDKSFLCIVLVYNQIPAMALFIVACLSEIAMNFLSVFIGYGLKTQSSLKIWCLLIGTITAVVFSFMILYETISMINEKKEGEETKENENGGDAEAKNLLDPEKGVIGNIANTSQISSSDKNKKNLSMYLKIFNITWIIFLSELGDKSQITTIILSAEYNPYPIFLGTALAHVLGVLVSMTVGYLISSNVNKVILSVIGACCFIYFGITMGMSFISTGGFAALLGK